MSDLPTAISGTRRQIRELVDGSLEVRIHIDPRFKADFHRIFPSIDMPIAIAPLVANFERIEQQEQKGGALCRLAAMWCKDEEFWQWLTMQASLDDEITSEDEAAIVLRDFLEIKSRKELDNDPILAGRFQLLVRVPFMEWRNTEGRS